MLYCTLENFRRVDFMLNILTTIRNVIQMFNFFIFRANILFEINLSNHILRKILGLSRGDKIYHRNFPYPAFSEIYSQI